jgi:hypothetical protein
MLCTFVQKQLHLMDINGPSTVDGGAASRAVSGTHDVAARHERVPTFDCPCVSTLVTAAKMCLVTRFKLRDGHYEMGPGAFFEWLKEGCPKPEDCAPTPTRTPRASTVGSAGAPGRDSIEDMRAYLDMNVRHGEKTRAPAGVETDDGPVEPKAESVQ